MLCVGHFDCWLWVRRFKSEGPSKVRFCFLISTLCFGYQQLLPDLRTGDVLKKILHDRFTAAGIFNFIAALIYFCIINIINSRNSLFHLFGIVTYIRHTNDIKWFHYYSRSEQLQNKVTQLVSSQRANTRFSVEEK